MPFCCIQHLSDVQAMFPAFVANLIIPVATPCALYHEGLLQYLATLHDEKYNCQNNKSFFAVCTQNIRIPGMVLEHSTEIIGYDYLWSPINYYCDHTGWECYQQIIEALGA